MHRRFVQLDVFTREALRGNPLAVVVDGDDPGFSDPSKPIGPFYTKFRARMMMEDHGWQMVEDSGRQ